MNDFLIVTNASKRLILAGFFNKAGEEKFKDKEKADIRKEVRGMDDEEAEKFADHHEIELWQNQVVKTAYPKPVNSYHLIFETYARPLESVYFWCINQLEDMGFAEVNKITDVFAASEQSTFFGISQQRLGLQQDKVAQYLAAIGKLVKDLFQIVREVRIIDERVQYYAASKSENRDVREPAEIALKGLFVDFVEGGSKSPASVYGLARELQFITLPDLFFSIHPRNKEEINPMVDQLEFNRKVKEVLRRKLFQYHMWRDATYDEIKTRRRHTIKYLRQHYDVIQLYMTWIKPYLRQISRLSMDQKKTGTADLVAAFEGSLIEIEVLGRQIPAGNKHAYTCLLLTFNYRTSPEVHPAEEYQRRIVHRGKIDIVWRAYQWKKEQIDDFLEMKNQEAFEMLSSISESIQAAMGELGEDLRRYLIEAGERFPGMEDDSSAKEEKPPERSGILEPFVAPFKGAGELFGNLLEASKAKKPGSDIDWDAENEMAGKMARSLSWTHYKNFKKAHKMVTW